MIALLSDIHSNTEALDACLAHARAQGASEFAFLGDLIGYGAGAAEVVATIRRYHAEGAVVIRGNHDDALTNTSHYLNENANDAMRWTRKHLSADDQHYLVTLPLVVRKGDVCFVHASAANPTRWDYVDSRTAALRSIDAANSPYTFSGHVHDQIVYFHLGADKVGEFRPTPGVPVPVPRHRRWLALVGSVGQPRDRNPAAAYAIFDPVVERMTFHRVPYDYRAAARRIRDAGLPEGLAYRVERGI